MGLFDQEWFCQLSRGKKLIWLWVNERLKDGPIGPGTTNPEKDLGAKFEELKLDEFDRLRKNNDGNYILKEEEVKGRVVTPDEIVDMFNKHFAGTDGIKHCSGLPGKTIRLMFQGEGFQQPIAKYLKTQNDWLEYFQELKESDAIYGPDKTWRGFKLALDWIVKCDNYIRVKSGDFQTPKKEEKEDPKIAKAKRYAQRLKDSGDKRDYDEIYREMLQKIRSHNGQ